MIKIKKKRNPLFDFKPEKLEDLNKIFGNNWKILWNKIKKETKSKIRKPSIIYIFDYPKKLIIHDYQMCLRFAFDVNTGYISDGKYVSSGEWSVFLGSNNDELLKDLPMNIIIVNVIWSDQTMKFEVQTSPNMLQKQLK